MKDARLMSFKFIFSFLFIFWLQAYANGQLSGQVMSVERMISGNEISSLKNSESSILSAGIWYKIKIQNEGVYKIDYDKLIEIGIDPSQIDPRDLRIYGNGGGMLPEYNAETEFDDPQENAIWVVGEDDGSFDQTDYILFYGQSPHQWSFNEANHTFSHTFNAYSDYTYYFITADLGAGKRIQQEDPSQEDPEIIIDDFVDYQFYEKDDRNLINSGRTWYGEIFDINTSQDFGFNFPHIVNEKQVKVKVDVAARSSVSSNFQVALNGTNAGTVLLSGINFSASYPPYARTASGTFSLYPGQNELTVNLQYQKPDQSSLAWLNYIELIAWRSLIFEGGQLAFRNPDYVNTGNILEYQIKIGADVEFLWDVSDPVNVKSKAFDQSGNAISFIQDDPELKEYFLFDNDSFLIPEADGEVSNQNYHGIPPCDLIIVSPSEFLFEAQRLADFHAQQDGLSFCVVEPQKIYNEFSSGAQDISAIRNFVRYLFDKADSDNKPRYLLLFGDASFDYKNRIEGNSNFVPTWESPNGVDLGNSYMSDDYFGLLGTYEGADLLGDLDIGIGRLPVSSIEEAEAVVDKILNYAMNSSQVMGSWRNKICLIGDDEDYNAYVNDSELIAEDLENLCPSLNIYKIYFDAYPQESTPGGERYPDATESINRNIEKGALVVNYIGHGGETGWAHERVLELSHINAWNNLDRLPVFITATCEFTRLDDPERKSAGEYVMTNPEGGGIALYTTTRATSAGGNYHLNKSVLDFMFRPQLPYENRLGDIVCASKNAIGNTINGKKFVLVGDPALRMAIPSDSLAVLRINDQSVKIEPDTIRALAVVNVEGSIYDSGGNKRDDYNGVLYPVVYDKPSKVKTLGQDNNSFEMEFDLMNNILYKGKASIINGDFSFSFVVPRDIAYNYDFGKISLYATGAGSDAWGYYDNLVIGGFDSNIETDLSGPEIELYMNNENFVSGDQIPKNSFLLAYISDESGINTVGSGIGHDIVAVLDEISNNPYVLNDYYEADLDSFTSGKIEYGFSGLENGHHTLELKAWDVHNNSSVVTIDFLIAESDELTIEQLINYPNPFNSETRFKFELNQEYTSLQIEIQIFNLRGQWVKTITKTNYNLNTVQWTGDMDNGAKLPPGIYIYRVIIQTETGAQAQKMEKLLIVR